MSRNPYLIYGPAVISFSGGRTSGYMLKHILDAHGGTLPDDVHVVFANTGRERAETLDFVRDCAARWNVTITWLEYRYIPGPEGEAGTHTYEVVNHNNASRNGEPFEMLIRARNMLPNPVMRFCTQELKVRPMKKFMQDQGYTTWDNVVGIRADEPMRVARMRAEDRKDLWDNVLPLATARVTRRDVSAFWATQPFDLQLENVDGTTPEGNCDDCFLKGLKTKLGLIRRRPDLVAWWIRMEELRPADPVYFRNDQPSYAQMLKLVQQQPDLFMGEVEDNSLPCGCHD